ncbi:pre-mRNA-splicing factor CWC25-like [Pseudomyrmex gracilis]|uniref:pre-mRNA-splicing factor CWC25-like n=1 Tax=Pseudomyrmex gracilis TaxID=219809 RepID=UPI0009956220|nr:pre-mRNA-splicing factor CWC25-like [Pseudomyrmex gracilis]
MVGLSPRKRRGLVNGVGSIAKQLFGTMNASDEKIITEHIGLLENRQEAEEHAIKNHLKVLNATVTHLNTVESVIQKNEERLAKSVSKIVASVNKQAQVADNRKKKSSEKGRINYHEEQQALESSVSKAAAAVSSGVSRAAASSSGEWCNGSSSRKHRGPTAGPEASQHRDRNAAVNLQPSNNYGNDRRETQSERTSRVRNLIPVPEPKTAPAALYQEPNIFRRTVVFDSNAELHSNVELEREFLFDLDGSICRAVVSRATQLTGVSIH